MRPRMTMLRKEHIYERMWLNGSVAPLTPEDFQILYNSSRLVRRAWCMGMIRNVTEDALIMLDLTMTAPDEDTCHLAPVSSN